MSKQALATIVGIAALFSSLQVHATPITIGTLNYDGSSNFITDTSNNRQWLRWDQLTGLTFAQVSAQIGSGGAFQGYQFAHSNEAQEFVDALLQGTGLSNLCTASNNRGSNVDGYCVTDPTRDYRGLVGVNHGNPDWSVAFFLSDQPPANTTIYPGAPVGYMGMRTGAPVNTTNTDGNVSKANSWADVNYVDSNFTSSGAFANLSSTWLLYKEIAVTGGGGNGTIPLPATWLLMLPGLWFMRRKRIG